MLWFVLWACQEPFDVDRHDLQGFRVAAIELRPDLGAAVARPRVAVVVDGRPWFDESPTFEWYWLPNPEALDTIDRAPDAEGPAPWLALPDARTLGVIARHGDDEQRSFIDWDRGLTAPTPAAALVATAVPVDLAADAPASLELDARRRVEDGPPTRHAAPSSWIRWRATDADPAATFRWTATAGTFLELDRSATDWVAADLTLDALTVEASAPEPVGPVTVVAVQVGEGLVSFTAADLLIGPAPDADAAGVWIGDRHLPGPTLTGPAWVTLIADDHAPSGLAYVDPEPTDDAPPLAECGEAGAFDAGSLLEARCRRSDWVGARVWVTP